MGDQIRFYNESWFWTVITVAALLLILFLWKEYKTAVGRLRFIGRTIVATFVIFSLMMIALKPMKLQEVDKATAVLLTSDYSQSKLDSLQVIHPLMKQFSYKDELHLEDSLATIKTLYILGEGIEQYDFHTLDNISAKYIGNTKKTGIVKIKYPQKTTVGETVVIKGLYRNAIKEHKLVLEDAGNNSLDSIIFDNGGSENFTLLLKPKVIGKTVYTIVEKDSLGTIISKEPLPLIIEDKKQLSILIANTFPTFETRYLKNFLVDKGHKVLTRNQLTKGIYKFENYNGEQTSIYGFTKQDLKEFDLVILDLSTLKNLDRSSLNALKTAVREDGLGLFIQPEDAFVSAIPRWTGLAVARINDATVKLSQYSKSELSTYNFRFKRDQKIEPLQTDGNHIVAAYIHYGLGRISSSALSETYTLVLDGKKDVYASIWSDVISGLSKKESIETSWDPSDWLIYKDEPYAFTIENSLADARVMANKNDIIPLKGDVFTSQKWSGITYPETVGWNSLSIIGDTLTNHSYYVSDTSQWKAKRAYDKALINRRKFNEDNSTPEVNEIFVLIPLFWFFILFVLGMGYLWLMPRYRM